MIWLRCPILNITALSDRSAMNESSGSKDFCGDRPVSKEGPFFSLTYAKLSIVVQNIPILTCGKMLVIDKKCDRP